MNVVRYLLHAIHDTLDDQLQQYAHELRWSKRQLAQIRKEMHGMAAPSLTEELINLLTRKTREYEASQADITRFRQQADELARALPEQASEIEALRTTLKILQNGASPVTPAPDHVPRLRPTLGGADHQDDCPNVPAVTPQHRTIDMGALGKEVMPVSAYTAVAEALESHEAPIRTSDLFAIIQKSYPYIDYGTVQAYLSQLYRDGLADRPERGMYVWVGEKGESDGV